VKKQRLVVTIPVANLRKEPVEASSEYVCDDLQETQLLFNECLLYVDEIEDWYFVEAAEQQKATPRGDWHGYPGWIRKTSAVFIDAWPELKSVVNRMQAIIPKAPLENAESFLTLSIGTRLAIENGEAENYHKITLPDGQQGWINKDDVNTANPVTDIKRLRSNIVETAKMFLGTPYLWGGRSACVPQGTGQGTQCARYKDHAASASNPSPLTLQPIPPVEGVVRGVDCSSLTNLAYRVNWVDIPRDAHDQWRVSTEIACDALAPADLIFVSAEEAFDEITHVMIYLAGEEFIEASETGSVVTINTFKKKFGLTLREAVRQDLIVNNRQMHFGSIMIAGGEK
jgi:gamma-D-glutamyl-L-lysine dipeptidyl-peptidase